MEIIYIAGFLLFSIGGLFAALVIADQIWISNLRKQMPKRTHSIQYTDYARLTESDLLNGETTAKRVQLFDQNGVEIIYKS